MEAQEKKGNQQHQQHIPLHPPPPMNPLLGIDPSTLTTQLVLREVTSLKELLTERIGGVEKGIDIAHQDLVRVPTDLQKAISSLQALIETKIVYEHQIVDLKTEHVQEIVQKNYTLYMERFNWIEKVRLEQKTDQGLALNTALASAKELVGLSNAAFTKQIDQMTVLITTAVSTLGDKIADVKDSVNESKSTTQGRKEGVSAYSGWIAFAIMLIGFLIALSKMKF